MGLRVSPPPASSFAVAGDPGFGLLRFPCPSTPASSELRVAPAPRPHERLLAISLGRPRFLAFRLTPTANLQVAPNLRFVCAPGCRSPGFPGPVAPRLYRLAGLRVSPQIVPSGGAAVRLRVAPTPASTAGSMVTPNSNRTLHPPAEPGMNLRLEPVLAHSCPALDAPSISLGLPPAVGADGELPVEIESASSCLTGTALPTCYRFTN